MKIKTLAVALATATIATMGVGMSAAEAATGTNLGTSHYPSSGVHATSLPTVTPAVVPVCPKDGYSVTWNGANQFTASATGAKCKIAFDSYKVPSTWDGKGFNATAVPQPLIGSGKMVTLTGYPMTVTVPKPTCGPYQADAADVGFNQPVVTIKGSLGFIAGGLVKGTDCPRTTTEVIPYTPPTVYISACTTDSKGNQNGGHTPATYVLPSEDHLTWSVSTDSGATWTDEAPGTYTYTQQTSIRATADDGFAFDAEGTTTKSKILAAPTYPDCIVSVYPSATVTQAVCKSGVLTSGYLTLSSTTGVTWKINGSAASAGKHNEKSGTYTVVATSSTGYGINGLANSSQTFTLTVHPATCVAAVKSSPSPPAGATRVLASAPVGTLAMTGGFGLVQFSVAGVVLLALGGMLLFGLYRHGRREAKHSQAMPII